MDIDFIDQANYYPETLHPLGQSSIGGVKRSERSAATLRLPRWRKATMALTAFMVLFWLRASSGRVTQSRSWIEQYVDQWRRECRIRSISASADMTRSQLYATIYCRG
jgi:hypothetical protein